MSGACRRVWSVLSLLAAVLVAATYGQVMVSAAQRAAPARKAAQKVVEAWIQIGANNPFWEDENRGAAEAARRYGFTFKAISGNNSVSDQANELEQLVNQHVSVILLTAIDISSMGPALQYAKAHGVPVVSLYSVSPYATVNSGFNEVQVGHDVGQYALGMLEKRYGKPEGTVAVLEGLLGQTLNAQRGGGFISVLDKYPGIHIVAKQPTDWLASNAANAMQDWLTKYPHLSLVYGLSDTITVPAINVAERVHRVCNLGAQSWKSNPSCILFASVDGDPIGITAIQQGQLGVTDLYAPIWAGYQFAVMGYKVATHQQLPKNPVLRAYLVTQQNVACVAHMQDQMGSDIEHFPFNGTLQQIAQKFGCKPAKI
jgi:ribose transport system substrate-binding protein